MSDDRISLLYVEDDEVDRMAFERHIREHFTACGCSIAGCVGDAIAALEAEPFDAIVSDYNLGDGTAFDVLERAGDTPVIIVTGMGDEDTAVRAIKKGASDYLAKDPQRRYLKVLNITVENAIANKKAALALEKTHEDMRSILNQLRIGVVLTDADDRVLFINQACRKLVRSGFEEGQQQTWDRLFQMDRQDALRLTDMMTRPSDVREKLTLSVDSGGQQYSVEVEVQNDPVNPQRKLLFIYDMTAVHDLRRLLNDQAVAFGIVGRSAPMEVVYEQINQLSKLDTTVLIEGETGTGKELAARAIHDSGHRRDKPFVALNCAGLTDSLLASQLFGHRRGAFTGAVDDQPGHFEAAHKGTLFLDEIGDISFNVQTSLLRVLQEREILRIGESKPRKVDVRIIAATHRDLNLEVQEGRFRADLLYRIRVARITLPPLRQRLADLPLLVESFMRRFRATSGKVVNEIGNQAMRMLMDHDWPGNVRELQSAIEFAAIRCSGPVITGADLPPEVLELGNGTPFEMNDAVDQKGRILDALRRTHGNRTEAARVLGMSRATFYRRLADMKITLA